MPETTFGTEVGAEVEVAGAGTVGKALRIGTEAQVAVAQVLCKSLGKSGRDAGNFHFAWDVGARVGGALGG